MRLYLDSSALVRVIRVEPESGALERYLDSREGDVRVTSALARVEVVRAVAVGGARAVTRARRLLQHLDQIEIDSDLLDRAADLSLGAPLRSLDAIHLASAQTITTDLRAVVTYDRRMAAAAQEVGIPVEAPI